MANKKKTEDMSPEEIMAEAAQHDQVPDLPEISYDTSELDRAFDDLTVADDGEGFRYAAVGTGAVLQGIASNIEQSKFGWTLVYATDREVAATKKRDGEKVEEILPRGAQVRVGYRKNLDLVFQMVKAGLRPAFRAMFLEKVRLDSGNTMWRVRLDVSARAIAAYNKSNRPAFDFEADKKSAE